MRVRVALALLGSVVALAASVGGGTNVSAAGCTLVPELRAFTINQGLNSYAKITRGKSAVSRFYFGLPSCANIAGGAYIQIRSAELTVSGTQTAFQTGQLGTEGPPPTYPNVNTSGTPTLADSGADVRFSIPGSAFATGSTAGYTATFSLKVFYKSAASSTARRSPSTLSNSPRDRRRRVVANAFINLRDSTPVRSENSARSLGHSVHASVS